MTAANPKIQGLKSSYSVLDLQFIVEDLTI